ncbi:putative copper chaperone for Cu/Zn superoxide dismutase, partial [Ostreococcus lucimarinus CCE9901]
ERALEFMVEMRCGGCAAKVTTACEALAGTTRVDASLGTNTVTVITRDAERTVREAIESAGYKARLIGQGRAERSAEDDDDFGEALAEALGTDARGTVRLVQVSEETILAEAALDGLSPGAHAIRVHEYGDLTRGMDSIGDVYGGEGGAGMIGIVVADENGSATMPSTMLSSELKAWDVIGRSVAVYAAADGDTTGAVCAVLARSAGVGANHKKLCQCDGTIIWEA